MSFDFEPTIETLQTIDPAIHSVLRDPITGGLTLCVMVGEKTLTTDGPGGPVHLHRGPDYRNILIKDLDLIMCRGTGQIIDLIRNAVAACKADKDNYEWELVEEPMGIGKEREAEMERRLGLGGATNTTSTYDPRPRKGPLPFPDPKTPVPPPKRFDEDDNAFAGRLKRSDASRRAANKIWAARRAAAEEADDGE